jgi:hypothetical protein
MAKKKLSIKHNPGMLASLFIQERSHDLAD